MTATQSKIAPEAQGKQTSASPMTMHKKVGNTAYTVTIHFSETNKETLEDKILKLNAADGAVRRRRNPPRKGPTTLFAPADSV